MTATAGADGHSPARAGGRAGSRLGAWLDALSWGAALMPLTFVAHVLLLALVCLVRRGVWPEPYRPDPKDIALPLQMELVGIFGIAGLIAPAVVLPMLWARCLAGERIGGSRRELWLLFAVHVVCVAAFWTLIMTDGDHRLLEWFAD